MADITMCQDGECPSASECHRYRAVPSDNQSYQVFDIPPGAFECEDFIQSVAITAHSWGIRIRATVKPPNR